MAIKFELKKLPYDYNALSPVISEETLKVHHDKHLNAYTNNFNLALESFNITANDISEILANVSDKPALRNNGGGYFNHNFYFDALSNNNSKPSDELMEKINSSFGSFDEFVEKFSKSAATNFGSGWTWLGVDKNNNLVIYNTKNQDNYLMDVCENNEKPILVIDIWEHAYYIDYQNRRPEYIGNFFKIINWDLVSKRFSKINI